MRIAHPSPLNIAILLHSKSIIFANMKFFAFIMACIVLILSCTYCADGVSFIKGNKVKVTVIKKSNPSQNNRSDNCSPFCQCNSCPGFYLSKIVTSSELITLQTSIEFGILHTNNLIGISLPIWQPPQLIS